MKITDYWFARLQWDIARIIIQLNDLQKIHRKITGTDFVLAKSVDAYKRDMDRLEDK